MRRGLALVITLAVVPVTAAAQEPAPAPPDAAGAPATPSTTTPAAPEEPRPPQPASWRLMLSDLSILRLNPVGIETRGRFGMQKRLYPSKKKIGENNFMFFGLYPKLNPASAHLAVGGEIQPVSMFNLRANAEVQQYFGTFGFLQSFPSPRTNYSDAKLDDLASSSLSTPAFHVSIQPLLQARFGPVAVRALFQLDYWDMKIRSTDTTAYEATFDTLLPDKGWTLSSDIDVLYTGKPRLAIGVRHSWVHPFYNQSHFIDQVDKDAYDGENAHQRIGLFGAYTLKDKGPSRFNKPTVVVILSMYLKHRFRTGEPDTLPIDGQPDDYTSRAFPYILVGFAFESDFLRVRY